MKKDQVRKEKKVSDQFIARQYQMWECIRRNKEYLKDYERYKEIEGEASWKNEEEGKPNDAMEEIGYLMCKWNCNHGLPDPKPLSDYEPLDHPLPDYPLAEAEFFRDSLGRVSTSHFIGRPGDIVKVYTDNVRPHREYIERKLTEWEIYEKGSWVKLTEENCPRSISIHVGIMPWYTKNQILHAFQGEFESAYKTVNDAQRAILGKRYRPHLDNDLFEKMMKVYDMRTQIPPMSFTDIALKLFPDETYKSTVHKNNKRMKKEMLPHNSARDKVEYYWKMANDLIDKGGYKYL